MSEPPPRFLGTLSDEWSVPSPKQLKALLAPDSEVESRFYESDLLFASGSRGDTPSARSEEWERSARAYFEVFFDLEGGLRWRLRQNGGGSVLAESSTSYADHASCREAIGLLQRLGLRARVEEQG